MLDASKAFDRVDFVCLFKKLIKRKIPKPILRLLLISYTTQSVSVNWNGTSSKAFGVSNGIRQDAILSGFLFTVYMDDLFIFLNSQPIGCTIHNMRINSIGFADDITLLAPTISALQFTKMEVV